MPTFMLAYSLGYNHEANKTFGTLEELWAFAEANKIGKGFILYCKPAVRGVSESILMGNL